MEYVIGVDLGTSSGKVTAVTRDGEVLVELSGGYPLQTSASGQATQEAREVWKVVQGLLRQLGQQLPRAAAGGLALSGAMHSILPVSSNGEPLAPALTWADNRAAAEARALRGAVDAVAIYQHTGCPLQPIYYPARLRWWLQRGLPAGTERWVGIKEWILQQMTGCWAIDQGMASTTGLFNTHRLQWDEEMLALAGITAAQLPRVVASDTQVGTLTGEAARQSGLPAGLPVFAGSHDGGLANLGAGAAHSGAIAMTLGTSGAIRVAVAAPALDPLMRTWCYVLTEGRWLAGGAINNGGLAARWVREQFYRDVEGGWKARMERLLAEAAGVPPGADGVLLLPYFAGERSPHWRPDQRATIHGLQLGHTRAHVSRALLEGVAFCLADVWQVLQPQLELLDDTVAVRLTGGITLSPLWMQIVADVLDVSLLPIQRADASALGAALVVLQGLGLRTNIWETNVETGMGPLVEPDPRRHALYTARHEAFQTLYRTLA